MIGPFYWYFKSLNKQRSVELSIYSLHHLCHYWHNYNNQAHSKSQDCFCHHQHVCTSYCGQDQVQTHFTIQRQHFDPVGSERHWKQIYFSIFVITYLSPALA